MWRDRTNIITAVFLLAAVAVLYLGYGYRVTQSVNTATYEPDDIMVYYLDGSLLLRESSGTEARLSLIDDLSKSVSISSSVNKLPVQGEKCNFLRVELRTRGSNFQERLKLVTCVDEI